MQYEQAQSQSISQTSQSFEQKDRVKQTGGIDIDHDVEHHEGSTLNTLENLSSSNVDHDAAEILHRGFEKATDKIAQGVEVVKRLIMQELPPVEGENIMEKAENLKEAASEKVQEVKEKVEEKVESVKEEGIPALGVKPQGSEEAPSGLDVKSQGFEEAAPSFGGKPQGSEEIPPGLDVKPQESEEAAPAFGIKPQGSEEVPPGLDVKPQGSEFRGARTSQQTDLYRSGSGSDVTWEPTQEMKDVARGKLGEFKEKFQGGQKESSGSPQESAVLIEQGTEKELSGRSNEKLHEIEDLSLQLNQKVEELKKSAGMPTNQAGETIIIIQEGGVAPQQVQTQYTESQQSFGGQSEQQRPMLGHRGEQEWRNYEAPSQGSQYQSNEGTQESAAPQQGQPQYGESQSFGGQSEQQRPKLGHRGEQEWRSYEASSQEGQSNEGERSLTGQLGDKIKEKVGEKASELKDSYQSNLQEIERKAEQRWTEQPKEHHESEHHLTTESESFKPTAESRSLLKQELPSTEGHHESEHHLSAESESFQPSRQSKNLLKKEFGGQGQRSQGHQGGQGSLESQGSNLKATLESQAGNLKGKLGEAAEQIKEKVLPSGEQGQGQSFKQQISQKVNEVAEKIMPLDEAEKQYDQSQEQGSAPPAEMKETVTYHPQEIRGYEIEYVPKHHEEGHESQSKGEQSEQSEESKPLQERIPFLDRVMHSFEGASQKYHHLKEIVTPGQSGQGKTSEETGYHEEHLRSGPPPSEIHENITYHPRDIRGYEVEYVPKSHSESSDSQGQSRGSQRQQAPPAEMKETITYHPRDIKGYEVEYVPKNHNEGQESQPQGQSQDAAPQDSEGQGSGQQQAGSERVPLLDRVQQGLGSIRGYFHHGQGEAKETVAKAPEKGSELSKILESQAEVLKTKYSALKDDQPHGEELLKSQGSQQGHESQGGEGQEGKGLFGRVSGALHNITDRFSHGASNLEGKITEGKDKILHKQEEQLKTESPREKIYEFNPKSKKMEEQGVTEKTEKAEEAEAKSGPGFVSRMGDRISHGIEGVKGKFHHSGEKDSEETSTEKNQSVFEKVQGKIQGKQTGEEVDKQGFKKVHDGFSETVDELKHEHNEQYLEQVHVANENPFEPLRTKQAAQIDHPVTSNEMVGGDLKKMTAGFDENKEEMIQEEDEEERKKRGLLQKMKEGIFSKFGHGNKENEESA